ncbi:hypothetical protein GCM10020331_038050 [Ectobacillus funiculus]
MEELNEKKHSFNMEDNTGRLIVKGEIIGESELEFYDDLKLKSRYRSHKFRRSAKTSRRRGKMDVFNDYMREIEETLSEVKKHSRFQGEII